MSKYTTSKEEKEHDSLEIRDMEIRADALKAAASFAQWRIGQDAQAVIAIAKSFETYIREG